VNSPGTWRLGTTANVVTFIATTLTNVKPLHVLCHRALVMALFMLGALEIIIVGAVTIIID